MCVTLQRMGTIGAVRGRAVQPRTPHRDQTVRKRRRVGIVAGVLGTNVVLILIVIQGALVAYHAAQAKAAATLFEAGLRSGDAEATQAAVPRLQRHAQTARQVATSYPLAVFTHVPGVRSEARAVTAATIAVDQIATQVAPQVADLGTTVSPAAMLPHAGRIDVAPILAVAPVLRETSNDMSAISTDFDAAMAVPLNPSVENALLPVQQALADAERALGTSADAAATLPGLLGADGPRDILVLVQNNAELRTRGGIAGATAVLRAEDGQLTLIDQLSTGSYPVPDHPVVDLGESEAIHTDRLGRYIQNVNLTPDFPMTATIARQLWEGTNHPDGQDVSVVVAIDPVALSYFLDTTGPVLIPGVDEQLTAHNAVETLLNTPYVTPQPPAQMDAFFALVAASVFDAILGGGLGADSVEQAHRAVGERRIMVWSARPDEQEILARYRIGGLMDPQVLGDSGVGVFFNQATASKLGYYLDAQIVSGPYCTDTGGRLDGALVTVTLVSAAPADITAKPSYLIGAGRTVPPGTDQQIVLLYTPPQAKVSTVTVNGEHALLSRGVEHGVNVTETTVTIPPGESVTVEVFVPQVDPKHLTLQYTPMARPVAVTQHKTCPMPIS